MNWIEALIPDRRNFLPGATSETISEVEKKLGVILPPSHKEFLRWIDGGQMTPAYIIYSAGKGIHPEETLLSANESRQTEIPLVFIAREAEEEFAFRVDELDQPDPAVYIYRHEYEIIEKVSESFEDFVKKMFI